MSEFKLPARAWPVTVSLNLFLLLCPFLLALPAPQRQDCPPEETEVWSGGGLLRVGGRARETLGLSGDEEQDAQGRVMALAADGPGHPQASHRAWRTGAGPAPGAVVFHQLQTGGCLEALSQATPLSDLPRNGTEQKLSMRELAQGCLLTPTLMRVEAPLIRRRLQNSERGTRPSGAETVDGHLSSVVCTPTPTMPDSVSVPPGECPGSSILTTSTAMSPGMACRGWVPPAELSTPWLGAREMVDEFVSLEAGVSPSL